MTDADKVAGIGVNSESSLYAQERCLELRYVCVWVCPSK